MPGELLLQLGVLGPRVSRTELVTHVSSGSVDVLAAVRSWSGPRAHVAAEVQREGKDYHEIFSV